MHAPASATGGSFDAPRSQTEPTRVVLEPPSPRRRMELRLLGGFGLRIGDQDIALTPGALRLLALLALHDRSMSREQAAHMLWPEASRTHSAERLGAALRELS